jgi:hypothetical protein
MVWHGLVDSDRLHRYYGYLADKYSKQESRLSWACIFLSSGAVVSVLSNHPYWAAALAVLVALFNAWLVIAKLSKRALSSASRQQRFGELQLEWERLWSEVSTMEDDEIRQRWKELSDRANTITEYSSVELSLDRRLRKRSEEEAYSVRSTQHSATSAA